MESQIMENLEKIKQARQKVEQAIYAYWNFDECSWNDTYEKGLELKADYEQARSDYHALKKETTLSELAEEEFRKYDHQSKIR